MEFLEQVIIPRFNFWIYVILMMIGMYAMISKNNLVKKLIGMSIFQTAIILFYVSIGVKHGASIPILPHDLVHAAAHGDHHDEEHADGTDGHVIDLEHPPEAVEFSSSENYGTPNDGNPRLKPSNINEPIFTENSKHTTQHSELASDHPEEAHAADHSDHSAHASPTINPDDFTNPLPHVLMLTAIVVGVATLGLALAITQLLYGDIGTIEEDEIIAKLNKEDADGDGNIDEFQDDIVNDTTPEGAGAASAN